MNSDVTSMDDFDLVCHDPQKVLSAMQVIDNWTKLRLRLFLSLLL